MKIEVRYVTLDNGEVVPRGLLCTVENENESILLDAVFGKTVIDSDGLIAKSSCECRLSDGYGEHYFFVDAVAHG